MPLVIAIFIATFIYTVQHRIYRNLWDKKFNIDISFKDDCLNVGDKSSLVEVINNDKYLPLPVIHVKFATSRYFKFQDEENAVITDRYHRNDVFSVMGNKKVTRKLDFIATRRGFYTVDGVNIIAKDFFMTKTFAKSIPNYAEMYVLPRKLYGGQYEVICNTMFGEIEARRSLFEDPFFFRGIREYSTRDSMSKINWRATAKTGELMVDQYGRTAEYRVKIFLNMDTNYMVKSEKIQELIIELVSTLSRDFLLRGIPVMVAGNGVDIVNNDVCSVDFGSAINHLMTIDKCLARIKNQGEMERFLSSINESAKSLDDSMAYVLVSAYVNEELLLKLDYLYSKNINVTLIVPYYDIIGFKKLRPYMFGWEVKLDET